MKTFVPGAIASAADVNANFTELTQAIAARKAASAVILATKDTWDTAVAALRASGSTKGLVVLSDLAGSRFAVDASTVVSTNLPFIDWWDSADSKTLGTTEGTETTVNVWSPAGTYLLGELATRASGSGTIFMKIKVDGETKVLLTSKVTAEWNTFSSAYHFALSAGTHAMSITTASQDGEVTCHTMLNGASRMGKVFA